MYIWRFEVVTKWSFHDLDDDGDSENFVVAANTFDLAWTKVKKLALEKDRKFSETDEESLKTVTYRPLSTELISVERDEWIDG